MAAGPGGTYAGRVEEPSEPRQREDPAGEQGIEPAPGEVLAERWELLEVLGRGGMGTVYRARDRVSDEEVAIKLLRPIDHDSEEMVERFRRELKTARRVLHPGVVRLHDLFRVGDRLALSMELVLGETLATRLHRSGPLGAGELGELALDLARALAAAHRAGIVHRDIKPSNIILSRGSGRPVITDFGISRMAHDPPSLEGPGPAEAARVIPRGLGALTETGQILGTPLYMAPEQFDGRAVGPPADVYALGLVLFEAATGRRPHDGDEPVELLMQRVQADVPPLAEQRPEVPAKLAEVVDRCLRRAPEDRFASGIELRAALTGEDAGTEHGQRVRTRAPGGGTALRRGKQLLAVGAALALVGGVSWWWSGRLPGADRRVAVRAVAADSDPWLAAAVQRLTERTLRAREPRWQVVSDGENVELVVTVRRVEPGAEVSVRLGRPGREPVLVQAARDRVVARALDDALEPVRRALGDGQSPRREPARAAALAEVGAPSEAALRAYDDGIRALFGAVINDVPTARRLFDEALLLHPGWGHALLGLMENQQWATGRLDVPAADPGADPTGAELIAAVEMVPTRPAQATDVLRRVWQAHPGDVMAGFLLYSALQNAVRLDESLAVLRRLHELRPDLQFGANLATALRAAGRAGEVPPLVERWIALAPESEQALAAQALDRLERGELRDVERVARDLLLLYGEAPHRLELLADTLIAAGRHGDARAVADRLIALGGDAAAAGRLRHGVVAVLEGRFSAAREAFEAVRRERGSEYRGLVYASAGLSLALGERLAAAAETRALAAAARARGEPQRARAIGLEAALLAAEGRGCPAIEPALEGLPPAERAMVKRRLGRLAAEAGCAPCGPVVAEGLAPVEADPLSLHWFARCAMRQKQWTLAEEALSRLTRVRTSSEDEQFSPAHAVLARADLSLVLEAEGRTEDARLVLEDFLAHWGKSDRPIAAVEEARRRLPTLRGRFSR